jgi:hypothetical protein
MGVIRQLWIIKAKNERCFAESGLLYFSVTPGLFSTQSLKRIAAHFESHTSCPGRNA